MDAAKATAATNAEESKKQAEAMKEKMAREKAAADSMAKANGTTGK
jgi:hypothetical protein